MSATNSMEDHFGGIKHIAARRSTSKAHDNKSCPPTKKPLIACRGENLRQGETYGKRCVSWICDYVTPDGKRKRKSFKLKKQAISYMN